MSSKSERVSRLLQWCLANRVKIDPRLSIVEDSTTGDISVYNSSDEFIPDSTSLVTIPKRSTLSIRTCSLSQILIDVLESRGIGIPAYGHEAKLTLALALYSELLSTSTTKWEGYLQSLPRHTVPIALFWGYRYGDEPPSSDADDFEVRSWIKGTEIERGFKNQETGDDILVEIEQFYEAIVYPILSCHWQPEVLSLRGFHHAYSLVSSRAFLVDAYHGLSMVPVADAFNHIQEHQVHLESDYNVCTMCGLMDECEHDEQGPVQLVCIEYGSEGEEDGDNQSERYGGDNDTCEMVTNCVIAPGSEVYNTYGEELSNADLLVQYGFILEEEGNEKDVVRFEYEELVAAVGEEAVERGVVEAVVARWGYEPRWDESGEVHNVVREAKRGLEFGIDAHGRVSHDLWVFCALCRSRGGDTAIEKIVGKLKKWSHGKCDSGDGVGVRETVRRIAARRMGAMEQLCDFEADSREKAMIQFICVEHRRILSSAGC